MLGFEIVKWIYSLQLFIFLKIISLIDFGYFVCTNDYLTIYRIRGHNMFSLTNSMMLYHVYIDFLVVSFMVFEILSIFRNLPLGCGCRVAWCCTWPSGFTICCHRVPKPILLYLCLVTPFKTVANSLHQIFEAKRT